MISARELALEGLLVLEPEPRSDDRGFLVETYRDDGWRAAGLDVERFVQDNQSRSVGGTLRGLHFQTHPGQAKLVRCARGRVFDVAVDLRRRSPTFGRWAGVEIDDSEHRQLFVPVGLAHGFCVLSEIADVVYKLSSYYHPTTEAGVAWDDPDIGVEWPVRDPILSARDRDAPRLAEVAADLPF